MGERVRVWSSFALNLFASFIFFFRSPHPVPFPILSFVTSLFSATFSQRVINSPTLCSGRPYAHLTKFFAQLYRRRVITKELLRSLEGTAVYGPTGAAKHVRLRTHRSECSIWLSSGAHAKELAPAGGNDPSIGRSPRKEALEPGLASPRLRRKQYNKVLDKNRSNLQKWKFRPLLLEGAERQGPDPFRVPKVSSSSASSGSNNPYGYIHYLSSEGSDSSSSGWSSPEGENPAGSGERGDPRLLGWKETEFFREKRTAAPLSIFLESKSNLAHASSFRSLPPTSPSFETYVNATAGPELPRGRVASTLDIPAPTLVIPFVSDDDEGSSTGNICNRTIYGSSSDEVTSSPSLRLAPTSFPRPTRPSLAYYFSSCSVEEDERSSCDFYETQRRHDVLLPSLSRSEPDLHYDPSGWPPPPSAAPRFQSHLVRVMKRVEEQKEECSCEAHSSRRSSDSGLADVAPHGDWCPMRGETPLGPGRASCCRLSRGSLRIGRCRSASLMRATTPEISHDCDSLFHTPTPTPSCTPCTSAPLSCVSDSSVSLFEAATLAAPSTTGIFRSGLYAHWWLKASVGLKPSKTARAAAVLSDIAERPEMPILPAFSLKPSYHPLRGQRHPHRPIPRIQQPERDLPESLNDAGDDRDAVDRSRDERPGARLELEDSSLCRDPSFESQASQATVIRRAEIHLSQPTSKSSLDCAQTPQASLRGTELLLSDISSMHSFYESEEGAGESSLWRDPSDGLVDLKRKTSLQSDVASLHSFKRPGSYGDETTFDELSQLSSPVSELAKLGVPEPGSSPLHRSQSLPKAFGLESPKVLPILAPKTVAA